MTVRRRLYLCKNVCVGESSHSIEASPRLQLRHNAPSSQQNGSMCKPQISGILPRPQFGVSSPRIQLLDKFQNGKNQLSEDYLPELSAIKEKENDDYEDYLTNSSQQKDKNILDAPENNCNKQLKEQVLIIKSDGEKILTDPVKSNKPDSSKKKAKKTNMNDAAGIYYEKMLKYQKKIIKAKMRTLKRKERVEMLKEIYLKNLAEREGAIIPDWFGDISEKILDDKTQSDISSSERNVVLSLTIIVLTLLFEIIRTLRINFNFQI